MSVQPDQALAADAAGDADAETPATHSGRLLVRMPGTLHAELAREADREGVSLNAFIVAALSGAVSWRSDPAARSAGAATPGMAVGGPPTALAAPGPATTHGAAASAAPDAPHGASAAPLAVPHGAAPHGAAAASQGAPPGPVAAVPAQPVVLAPTTTDPSRSLSLALAVNLVVVVLAAAAAVGLLIAAWPG
jgi:hypothetical protein